MVRLGEIEESMGRKIAEVGEALQTKVTQDIRDMQTSWSTFQSDTLPALRDSITVAANEEKEKIKSIRKKLDTTVNSLTDKLDSYAEAAQESALKQLTKVRKRVLDELAKDMNKTTTAMREVATTVTREELTRTVNTSLNISPKCLEAAQADLEVGIDKAISASLEKGLSQVVLDVVRDNLNKDLGDRVQGHLAKSVQSIKTVLMHDLKGALQGELQRELINMGKPVIAAMRPSIEDATRNFFLQSSQSLVDFMVEQLNAGLAAKQVTMTPETLAPFFTKLHEDVVRMLAPTVAHGQPIVIAPFTSPPHWSSTPIAGGSGEGAGGLADSAAPVEVKEDEDTAPEESNGELSF